MSRTPLAAVAGLGLLLAGLSSGAAQWYTPQSDRDLRLTWNAERIGPSRVLILGAIRNLSEFPAMDVVLRAEGLDQGGKVVSRTRAFVANAIPPRGSSAFEIRLTTSGSEREYRVSVDSFEFRDSLRRERQSP